MASQHTLGTYLLRCFINPFSNNEPIEFRSHLQSAKHILILCPESYETSAHMASLKKITALFPKETVQLVIPGQAKYNPDLHKVQKDINRPVIFPDASKNSLWKIFRSQALNNLKHQPPDVLIDIDPESNLLNLYLCKLFASTVRIGFSKPYSHSFYNIEYSQRTELSYGLNLENFYQFLQALTT